MQLAFLGHRGMQLAALQQTLLQEQAANPCTPPVFEGACCIQHATTQNCGFYYRWSSGGGADCCYAIFLRERLTEFWFLRQVEQRWRRRSAGRYVILQREHVTEFLCFLKLLVFTTGGGAVEAQIGEALRDIAARARHKVDFGWLKVSTYADVC
jgi:hypothetical protein